MTNGNNSGWAFGDEPEAEAEIEVGEVQNEEATAEGFAAYMGYLQDMADTAERQQARMIVSRMVDVVDQVAMTTSLVASMVDRVFVDDTPGREG